MKNRSTLTILLIVGGIGLAVLVLVGVAGWMMFERERDTRDQFMRAIEAEQFAQMEELQLPPATVFGEPAPIAADEARAFATILDELGTSLLHGDQATTLQHMNTERLTDEVVRIMTSSGTEKRFFRGFRESNRQMVEQNMASGLMGEGRLRWNRTKVQTVRWSENRLEAIVAAVHRPSSRESGTRFVARWWLIKQGDVWKVYDMEEVAIGWRLSVGLAHQSDPQMRGGPGGDMPPLGGAGGMAGPPGVAGFDPFAVGPDGALRIDTAIVNLREALQLLFDSHDTPTARLLVGSIRDTQFPPELEALRQIAEGTVQAREGDPAAALTRFDEAERLLPGLPLTILVRAEALSADHRYNEALETLAEFTRHLGPNSLGHVVEGQIREGQKQPDAAATAYRKALDENPDHREAFQGLRRSLPANAKAELGDRLGKATDPGTIFALLVERARTANDEPALAALIAGLKKARPGDPRAVAEELRGLVAAKKFDRAAEVFRLSQQEREPGFRSHVREVYLYAMLPVGKGVEAYQAVLPADAAASFRVAAVYLSTTVGQGDPNQPNPNAVQLAALIAAHREHDPGDPWLFYYDGYLHQTRREFERAEKAFADGEAAFDQRPSPTATQERTIFRMRRLDCLYDAGQGLKAYQTIAPPAVAFRHLAHRYDVDKNLDGLEKLVAAHRKQFAGDLILSYWEGEIHFLKGEYEAAAMKFRDYREESGEMNLEAWQTTEKLIRSQLRSGNLVQARYELTTSAINSSPNLWAALFAAEGNLSELERLLASNVTRPDGLTSIYYDPDFTRLFAADKFAALRRKYPDPRPKMPMEPQ